MSTSSYFIYLFIIIIIIIIYFIIIIIITIVMLCLQKIAWGCSFHKQLLQTPKISDQQSLNASRL